MSLQKKLYYALIGLSFLATVVGIYYLTADYKPNSVISIGLQGIGLHKRWSVRYVVVGLATMPSLPSRRGTLVFQPHLFGPDNKERLRTPFKVMLFISNNASCWETAPKETLRADARDVDVGGDNRISVYTVAILPKLRNVFVCDVDLSIAEDFIRRSVTFAYWDTAAYFERGWVSEPASTWGPWVPLVVGVDPGISFEDNYRVLYGSEHLPTGPDFNPFNTSRMIQPSSAGAYFVVYRWDDASAARVKDALLVIVGGCLGLLCSVILEMTERIGKAQ